MPDFIVGGETVKRKHAWMPCALNDRIDALEPAEQARLFKAAYWADLITNAEWPVVLNHDNAARHDRSRLKRKGAGWLMALARISVLNPVLFRSMCEQARMMYAEQVGNRYPSADMVVALSGLKDDDEAGWVAVVQLAEGHKALIVTEEFYDEVMAAGER